LLQLQQFSLDISLDTVSLEEGEGSAGGGTNNCG